MFFHDKKKSLEKVECHFNVPFSNFHLSEVSHRSLAAKFIDFNIISTQYLKELKTNNQRGMKDCH